MKHYAPYIENIIPAFQWNEQQIIIKIPFEHHQTIGPSAVVGFAIQIKDALQEDNIEPIIIKKVYNISDSAWTENVCVFEITDQTIINQIKQGRYYKIALAYIDYSDFSLGEIGYWSHVGIAKCTRVNTPTITITSDFKAILTLAYNENSDLTEKLYSVNFSLYHKNNEYLELLECSDEIIVNYQTQASNTNTIVEHQFNSYFENKIFEEILNTNIIFQDYDYIINCGIEANYVEEEEGEYYYSTFNNVGVLENREQIQNNIADFDVYDGNYSTFLRLYNKPYYQICYNLYLDNPQAYDIYLFTLKAEYKTINNYTNEVVLNNFSNSSSYSNTEFIIDAKNNYDNGLIQIDFEGAATGGIQNEDWEYISVSGTPLGDNNFRQLLADTCFDFILLRKNLVTGQVIRLFSAYNIEAFLDKESGFQDLGIEQGIDYEYILLYKKQIKQYYRIKEDEEYVTHFNNHVRSHFIKTDVVQADFEDCFLYDNNQQLRLRFNPKISSYKINIPQSKQETIGGKFPFVFENRQIRYKEFPISFLISYLLDTDGYFYNGLTDKYLPLKNTLSKSWFDSQKTRFVDRQLSNVSSPLNWSKTPSTNLTKNNIYLERQFKMAVLDWLTNGQIKVFKSPVEGNVIVKLINISMAPQDTLGRMLHTLSGTAIEVEEYTDKFLQINNFLLYQTESNKILGEHIVARDVVFQTIEENVLESGETYSVYEYRAEEPDLTVANMNKRYVIDGSVIQVDELPQENE